MRKIIHYFKFIVCIFGFITSSGIAEYRVDNYFPKSGVVGQDMDIQLNGQFGKNVKAVLFPSKENTSIIGSVKLPIPENDNLFGFERVFVKNDIAYVSMGYKTYIIDVSNKSNPKILHSVDFYTLYMTDNYLIIIFFKDNKEQIGIIKIDEILFQDKINVLSLSSSLQVRFFEKSGKPYCCFILNDSVYKNTLVIVDISNSVKPIIIATYPITVDSTKGRADFQITIDNNMAYVVIIQSSDTFYTYSQSIQIIDISDFSNLKNKGLTNVFTGKRLFEGISMFLEDKIHTPVIDKKAVYIPCSGGMHIVNKDAAKNCKNISFVDTKSKELCHVNLDANYAYLINFNGLIKVDITDSLNPVIIGRINPNELLVDAVVSDNTAFILEAGMYNGYSFKIIDLNDLSHPMNFGNIKLPDISLNIEIDKSYAYLASYKGSVQIIDVFDPMHPNIIKSIHFPENLIGIKKIRDHEYMVASESKLIIINTTDIQKPTTLGTLSIKNKIKDVVINVEKNCAFVAWEDGVKIVDITNRFSPEIIAKIDYIRTNAVLCNGDKLFIAGHGLKIFDINEIKTPKLVGSTHSSSAYESIVLQENTIYAMSTGMGNSIRTIDISNPSNIQIIEKTSSLISIGKTSFLISDYQLYQTGWPYLSIYDIKDSFNLKYQCTINTYGISSDIQVYNGVAFVAKFVGGLTTFLLPIKPQINYNSQKNILLTIPGPKYPGNYILQIYDNSINLSDIHDNNAIIREIYDKSVIIPINYKTPFLLSSIPAQVISTDIKEAEFSLSITPTLSETAIEDYTVSGHSGIQTMLPDNNISVSLSNGNVHVKIKPERHQYGTIPIHITVSDGYASQIATFDLTVKFPQICYQYDGILKSAPEGILLTKIDRAIDINGFVYKIDQKQHCIMKLDTQGAEIQKWGGYGSEIGLFNHPSDIAFDANGFVYVADSGNHRIQVFTSYGEFITLFGEYGQESGQFHSPDALFIDDNDILYVNDDCTHRIQAFQKVDYTEGKTKAIIIAGGDRGDNIWNAIKTCANFAYRTLISQGLNKEDIFYLSSDTDIDFDKDDMIDAYASHNSIRQAIENCKTEATGSLVIYLVDHGLTEAFKINEKETLLAETLNLWLNAAQEVIPGKLIVIYDACHSASFIEPLSKYSPNRQRIVMTSSAASEKSRFDARGAAAFSSHLWSSIFNGYDVKSSFESAKNSITCINSYQNPQVDANGDGQSNTPEDLNLIKNVIIGNGTFINSGIPLIRKVWTTPKNMIAQGNGVNIHVSDIYSQNGISQVWAVITPPYTEKEYKQIDMKSMPSIELFPIPSSDDFVGRYNGLSLKGTYRIAVFAKDNKGIISKPAIVTIEVNNNLKRKAIIISSEYGKYAYQTLKFQGYSDHDIYYYSSNTNIKGVDARPDLLTLKNLFHELHSIENDHVLDLVIHMAGNADQNHFYLNENESLSHLQMNAWLSQIEGMVTVIFDAPYSWNYLDALTIYNNKPRILISGSSKEQTAHFLKGGIISFSRYFWDMIFCGKSVLNAYKYTKTALSFFSGSQSSCIVSGKMLSENYYIGNAYFPGNTVPVIDTVTADINHKKGSAIEICARLSTSSRFVKHVWAFIHEPAKKQSISKIPLTELPHIELTIDQNNHSQYKGSYDGLQRTGKYTIGLYAVNTDGNISLPVQKSLEW